MEAATKENLTNRNLWIRLAYMVGFGIVYVVAETIVAIVAVAQFLTALLTGSVNAVLLRFGGNLSAYVYQILLFVTFNSEALPFPFSDWPNVEPGTSRWLGQTPAGGDGGDPPAP